ncbi:hypothetical protein IGI04_008215 [Brassica rapa subsp. trilocularis]|uniref:Uncharacterized protein n=1 Tax=Brassica rapa subsp. trilocularis TaxID=1813537 RepID=A0ABQ7NN46_BRACM|nr:hypothetical protein IGI04_008215 [Brassica rapa subsp. trilocularis]
MKCKPSEKVRGAVKIESHRVLAGKSRNTLQGRTASKKPNVEHIRAGSSIGMQQERGGMDLSSCVVTNRFSFRIEPYVVDWSRIASLSILYSLLFSLSQNRK